MTISALIVARNEQDKIEKTLLSLDFVDEVVVILDRSTDNTKKICRKFTKNIFEGSWMCEGKRRNYGIKKCKSEWIFEIDADEIISNDLSKEITSKKDASFDFYYIPLLNYVSNIPVYFGWMACLAPDGKFCMFKKKSKHWDKGLVHPNYKLIGKKGPSFKNSIDHYMSDTLSQLIRRFNRNSSLYSEELKEKNTQLSKLFSIRKIFSRFIKCYVTRKGFKSGGIGLLVSVLISIYPYVSALKSTNNN